MAVGAVAGKEGHASQVRGVVIVLLPASRDTLPVNIGRVPTHEEAAAAAAAGGIRPHIIRVHAPSWHAHRWLARIHSSTSHADRFAKYDIFTGPHH